MNKKLQALGIAVFILGCLGLKHLFCIAHARAKNATPPRPSQRVLDERRPLPPDVLANALQDRIHATSGPFRAAKSVKVRKD